MNLNCQPLLLRLNNVFTGTDLMASNEECNDVLVRVEAQSVHLDLVGWKAHRRWPVSKSLSVRACIDMRPKISCKTF